MWNNLNGMHVHITANNTRGEDIWLFAGWKANVASASTAEAPGSSGVQAVCRDGTYSYSAARSGTRWRQGGVAQRLR